MVMSTGCFYRRLEFSSLPPTQKLTTSSKSNPKESDALSWSLKALHIHSAQSYMQARRPPISTLPDGLSMKRPSFITLLAGVNVSIRP